MKINLKAVLSEHEKLEPGEVICPVMSRFEVGQGPMSEEVTLKSFTIVCVGELCGMYRKCFNIRPGEIPTSPPPKP